jgi:hypothetical protein
MLSNCVTPYTKDVAEFRDNELMQNLGVKGEALLLASFQKKNYPTVKRLPNR